MTDAPDGTTYFVYGGTPGTGARVELLETRDPDEVRPAVAAALLRGYVLVRAYALTGRGPATVLYPTGDGA